MNIVTEVFSHITTAIAADASGLKFIGAGIAVLTCFGTGLGQGFAAGKAVEAIARNPEVESKIRSLFIIGSAISESGAIYGLVVSLLLIFVV